MSRQTARDSLGVLRAVDQHGTSWTYAAEWPDKLFVGGGTGSADLRTVSKGSSRGAGPKVKQGRVRRRGELAAEINRCAHGQAKACCSSCGARHCACPGSPAHVCAASEAA